ncbi:ead/Ea22-like family protein [Escherichia coli]|nr:ead/Ea22-like family protein [Escherichia coli]
MSDITELALLVSKAKASVFTLEYISQFEPADIDSDDVDLRFEVDGRDTGTNVSIVDECGQAAKVIGALVEALEKAQQENTDGVAGMAECYETTISMLRSRIAELESRTVKLPKPHAHLIWIQAGHAPDDYWDDVAVSHSEKDRCCDGSERYPVYARWEIEEMLAAAGIKVEAE